MKRTTLADDADRAIRHGGADPMAAAVAGSPGRSRDGFQCRQRHRVLRETSPGAVPGQNAAPSGLVGTSQPRVMGVAGIIAPSGLQQPMAVQFELLAPLGQRLAFAQGLGDR